MTIFKNPGELVTEINKVVIGQEKAAEIFSLYMFKHLMKLYAHAHNIDLENKTNLLILGDTGAGKTFLVKTACELMDIPLVEINAKSIAQEGWHGTSFLELLKDGLRPLSSQEMLKVIVFIDEFDKMCITNMSHRNGDNAVHVQSSILKYLEGMSITVNGRIITTTHISFVLAGNFKDIREKRLDVRTNIGFTREQKLPEDNLAEELENFGVLPEIVGRISETIELEPHSKRTYFKISQSPSFMLYKWSGMFRSMGANFQVSKRDIVQIITRAAKKKLGVRGLVQESQKLVNREIHRNIDKLDFDFMARFLKDALERAERPLTPIVGIGQQVQPGSDEDNDGA